MASTALSAAFSARSMAAQAHLTATALSAQFAVASTTATLSQCTAATPATVPAQQLVPATWLLTVNGAIRYNFKPCRFYVLAIP